MKTCPACRSTTYGKPRPMLKFGERYYFIQKCERCGFERRKLVNNWIAKSI